VAPERIGAVQEHEVQVVHPEAAQRAREARLRVVMDRCMMKEHHRLRQAGLLDDPGR